MQATASTTSITSDRVAGTNIFNPAGDLLGSIEHLVIDKRSGTVRYVVLEFGGILGMGVEHYPLPWAMLKYDAEKEGYVVPLEKEQLTDAPRYPKEVRPSYDDAFGQSLYEFYGTPWL